jgi:hypothetical protein
MDDIIPSVAALDDHFAFISASDCVNPGGGRAIIKINHYLDRAYKINLRGKTIPGSHTLCRRQVNIAQTALSCIMRRYAKVTKGSRTILLDTVECFDAFTRKFCRDFTDFAPLFQIPPTAVDDVFYNHFILAVSPRTLGFLYQLSVVCPPEDYTFHLKEYAKSLQSKHLPSEMYDREIDRFSSYISFFSKKQAKPDIRIGYLERDKAPQGISAFSKELNYLLSAYSRTLSAGFQSLLLPQVKYNSNESDACIGDEIGQILTDMRSRDRKIDAFICDFAEYDSTQYELSAQLNSIFMLSIGASLPLVNYYRIMRFKWRLGDDTVTLYGKQKMHSGEPFTLFGNTLFGMMVLARLVDFDELACAIFKGDDSSILGDNITIASNCTDWANDRGLVLKIEQPPAAEFAGIVVTPVGYIPDALRRTAKVLSNVYHDKAHYNEAIINLRADLDCIRSQENLVAGVEYLRAYYNYTGLTNEVTSDQIMRLLGFLNAQANVCYHELQDFNKDGLVANLGVLSGMTNTISADDVPHQYQYTT